MNTSNNAKRIFTLPNILSVFRILLIPFIIVFYTVNNDYITAVILVIVSAVTDMLDGFIARRFDQVTDLGKILDPISDKLTQGAIILCLTSKYRYLWIMIVLFALKELTVGILGLLVLKRANRISGAQWYGKLCTTVTLIILGLLLLFPFVYPDMPDAVAYILSAVCTGFILFSLVMYGRFFIRTLKETEKVTEK